MKRQKLFQKTNKRTALVYFASFLALAALMISGCTKKVDDTDTTLHLVNDANVKGLDPVQITDTYSSLVASQIYEPLLTYHYLKRPLELVPALSDGMPEVSKDSKIVTFKIKKGLKYQDDKCFSATQGKGREVVADDFIYAWKRLSDPANKSENFWVFDGKIKGLNEWRDKVEKKEVDYSTPVEGLTAVDSHTLKITLNEPYHQLLYVLAMVFTAPVPKECVDSYGAEFLNNPVGTGPYKVGTWTRNSKIELIKNTNWRGETYPTEGEAGDTEKGLLADAGKSLPFVEKVVFHEMIEDQPRWLNLIKGNLDIGGIPKDSYDSAVKDGKLLPEFAQKGLSLQISEEPDVTYTAFNMDDPVLGKSKYLRQALSLAVDKKSLMEKFYNNRVKPAHSPIPPTVDGFDPNFKNPYADMDKEKAKELLKKAGYPEGKGLPELTYDATNSATARQLAEFYQQEYASIGVKMGIQVSTWPEFTKRTREKKAQIFGMAWVGDYPDAQNFLQLFYGKNAAPGPNLANYRSKEFDALYEKAMKLPSSAERTALYQKMRDVLVEDAPWAFGVHRLGYRVQHGWVHNYKRHITISDYVKYIRVDPKKRAELKPKL